MDFSQNQYLPVFGGKCLQGVPHFLTEFATLDKFLWSGGGVGNVQRGFLIVQGRARVGVAALATP